MSRLRLGAVTGCLLALLVCGLAVLSRSAPRRSGTNIAPVSSVSIALGPGQELCQPGESAPADTASVRLIARSSGPAGRLRARLLGPAGALASGSLAAGWHSGTIEIPVSRIRRTTPATLCLRNEGATLLVFGGATPAPPYTLTVAGHAISGRIRLEYMRPGSESWLQMIGTLTYRFSLGRSSLMRWWASAAVLALMLAVLALTVRILLRPAEEER